ncbi:MAG: 3-keto-5-aminohexanoate cleavage protein, partial [Oscillospiraceae bacterium]|nr:3-keto-5-aminohexanoate cleavage protein [Oscillospiraceae bacterium]
MAKKTIITVATTGAWPKKENNPNVPMTPEEICEDVYACWKAGAAIAHLHMRDDDGNGTMSKEKFAETVKLLRERHPDCDVILNLTTSGDLYATDETRQIHLKEIKPEMASYDCGSMNWMHSALFLNTPAFLEELGKNMQEWGVKPEIEA